MIIRAFCLIALLLGCSSITTIDTSRPLSAPASGSFEQQLAHWLLKNQPHNFRLQSFDIRLWNAAEVYRKRIFLEAGKAYSIKLYCSNDAIRKRIFLEKITEGDVLRSKWKNPHRPVHDLDFQPEQSGYAWIEVYSSGTTAEKVKLAIMCFEQ